MNRSKVGSTDQIMDQKIKRNRSTDKKMYLRCNLDEIKMQFRCNLYATYQQIKSKNKRSEAGLKVRSTD